MSSPHIDGLRKVSGRCCSRVFWLLSRIHRVALVQPLRDSCHSVWLVLMMLWRTVGTAGGSPLVVCGTSIDGIIWFELVLV
eukprot:1727230-Amphidinium_carterae.1